MTSILLSIVIICLMAALLIYGFKPYDYGGSIKRFKKVDHDSPGKSKNTKWRSVRIRSGLIACKAVSSIKGQIFLAPDAPSLPLENCTEDCRCHYVFLDDRRNGTNRRIEFGQRGGFMPGYGSERRRFAGRRLADHAV
jgi:hypothetical protein